MKTEMKLFNMSFIVLVSLLVGSCSSDDSIISQLNPTINTNVVTMTTTVSLDGGGTTRALTSDGKKTFAVGDKIAIAYMKNAGGIEKVETEALTAGDITNDGKTASFTVTLTNPKPNGKVKYIYPAAMAGVNDQVNYDALKTQDGTLANIAVNLDLAVFEGNLTESAALPNSPTLTNPLVICAYTIKNSDGSSEITNSITRMTIYDGTNSYTITRSENAGPIYVAMLPVSSANIKYRVTDGDKNYTKLVTNKTYEARNFYQLGLRMAEEVTYKSCPDENHPHAIDLFLPSGTMWACCNVGAANPEGFGTMYTWDDANATNAEWRTTWGASWQIPSDEQISELLTCSWSRSSVNSKNYYTFTGNNGGIITLPAINSPSNDGKTGYYWASTLYNTNQPYVLKLAITYVTLTYLGSSNQFAIRLVQ